MTYLDGRSKRQQLLKQARNWSPYLVLIGLIACITVIVLAVLGPITGNVFSNIYTSDPFCNESVTAKAWLDQNGDGVLDSKELSLPEVKLSIGDSVKAADSKGEADTLIWTQCQVVTFTVVAQAPYGYRFTTPNTVTVTTTSGYGRTSVYFGLAYLPGAPTVTPRPPSPKCVSYLEEVHSRSHYPRIAISQNGAVWAAFSGEGIFRYDAARNDWIHYSTRDGLISTEITSIAVDQDNAVWIGTEAGLARFDGISWSTYTRTNGLPSDSIDALALSPRNGIWVSTWSMVRNLILNIPVESRSLSYFDFSDDIWKHYQDKGDGSPNDWPRAGAVAALVVAPDGSIWMRTTTGSILHLISGMRPDEKNAWARYETVDARALHITSDNSVWAAGEKGIAHFDPITEKWTFYHHTTDNFTALDQAKDGSLWIGTWGDGIRHLILAPNNSSNDIWETYTSEDGLASDNISDVKVAPDGTVWFATPKGLSHCAFASR